MLIANLPFFHEDIHYVIVTCCRYNLIVGLSGKDIDYGCEVVKSNTHYVLFFGFSASFILLAS
jgi:hypothetical protein